MESSQQESSSQAQNFSCGYCEIAIQSVSDLKDHLLSNHKEENLKKQELKVDIKNESSKEPKHEIKKKQNKEKYYCETCQKGFSNLSNFKRHMRINHEDSHVKCDLCDMVFDDKDYMQTHIQHIHNDKKVKCDT